MNPEEREIRLQQWLSIVDGIQQILKTKEKEAEVFASGTSTKEISKDDYFTETS